MEILLFIPENKIEPAEKITGELYEAIKNELAAVEPDLNFEFISECCLVVVKLILFWLILKMF